MKKTKKLLSRKFLSILSSLSILICILAVGSIPASAANWTDEGICNTAWYSDIATEYNIGTAAELAGLSSLVRSGIIFTDKTINLTGDIDLGANEWVPIGTSELAGTEPYYFNGTLNGMNHTITGLKTGTASNPENSNWVNGLFAQTDVDSLIIDLNVEEEIYTAFDGGNIGGITGFNSGMIQNCNVSGNFYGVSVNPSGIWIGGITAGNYGTISGCSSSVTITGGDSTVVGGLAGDNSGLITDCFATGNVTCGDYIYTDEIDYGGYAGGFAGENFGMITNCYATGTVVSGIFAPAGGFVGYNSWNYDTETSILNCYATGAVTGSDTACVGGFAGFNVSNIQNAYSAGAVTGGEGSAVGGFAGESFKSESGEELVLDSYYNSDALQTVNGIVRTDSDMIVGTGLSDRDQDNTGMTTEEMADADFVTVLNQNRSDTDLLGEWIQILNRNNDFPMLKGIGDANVTPVTALSTEISQGSATGSAKIASTAGTGNSLFILVSSSPILTPYLGDMLPGEAVSYQSGSDITGLSAGKFIGVYEADAENNIISFKLITVTTEMLKAAPVVSPEVISPSATPSVSPEQGTPTASVTSSAGNTANENPSTGNEGSLPFALLVIVAMGAILVTRKQWNHEN